MDTETKFQNLVNAWLEPAVSCWMKDQIRNEHKAFYCYYKPGKKGENGAMVIAESPLNEDWILATPERISPFKSPNTVKAQLIEVARRLPILAY